MAAELHRYKHVAENERGILYFLHGFADYCDRWSVWRDFLLDNGISFYGHDQRGCGHTTIGDRAYVEDFDIYVNDSIGEIEAVRKENPDTPILIMGHSMGGLLATIISIRRPDLIQGSLLSAPFLKLSDNVSPTMKKLAWTLSSIAPKFYLPWNSLDRTKLTPNQAQLDKDGADPLLWHYGTRAGMATAMFKAVAWANENLGKVQVRTAIFHGKGDDICDIEGSRAMLAANKNGLVEMVTYDYNYHSLMHLMPEDSKKVMEDFMERINSMLSK